MLAAAGLSSTHASDWCSGTSQSTSIVLWPPGQTCTSADGTTTESGSAVGFLAILAAGLVLVLARPSFRTTAVAAVFGVAGLTQIPLGMVPALGFGWFVGGYIGFSMTRSRTDTLLAIGALSAGGLLDIVAGPAAWVVVLLVLIAFTRPEVQRRTNVSH